jgi:hypothetical protein
MSRSGDLSRLPRGMLYFVTLALHVIVAVLGVGLLTAIPVTAASARRAKLALSSVDVLDRFFRYTQWSLAGMLVTGACIELSTGGAFHGTTWFRGSFALLVFVGFSHARARAAFRRGLASGADPAETLRRVERWGWVMCATVTAIVVLMELKPFQ